MFFLIGPVVGYERLWAEPLLCAIQAVGIQYTIISSVCWISCRAIQLYLVAVRDYDPNDLTQKFRYPSHIFSWFFPLIPVVVSLLFSGKPQIREYWCWINDQHSGIWEWTCFYGVLFLLLTPIIFFWFSSVMVASKHLKQTQSTMIFVQNLGGVLLVLFLYFTEVSYEAYHIIGIHSTVLQYLHVFTYPFMGCICLLSFGLTPHTVKECKNRIKRFCCKKKSYENLVGV